MRQAEACTTNLMKRHASPQRRAGHAPPLREAAFDGGAHLFDSGLRADHGVELPVWAVEELEGEDGGGVAHRLDDLEDFGGGGDAVAGEDAVFVLDLGAGGGGGVVVEV